MDESVKIGLGEQITVQTLPGRGGKPIGRLQDGRVILFDQKSPYFNTLALGQSVECKVIAISENYVIVSPTREPELVEVEPDQEPYTDEIMEELERLSGKKFNEVMDDLEKMIGRVPKNAKTIPRALIHIIRLQQLIIRILTRGDQFSHK
jgi:hypothetical protein